MKINNISINQSNVSIIDQSSNTETNNYGISQKQIIELQKIIENNTHDLKESLAGFKNIIKEEELKETDRLNIIDKLKKFGANFASSLTTSGIIEVLKMIFI